MSSGVGVVPSLIVELLKTINNLFRTDYWIFLMLDYLYSQFSDNQQYLCTKIYDKNTGTVYGVICKYRRNIFYEYLIFLWPITLYNYFICNVY